MFAKTPKTLLILYPNSLRVYYGKDSDVSQLDFSKDLIDNFEVVNPSELAALISSSLRASGLKPQEALLLLSSEALEQKVINSSDQMVLETEANKFFENSSFSKDTLSKLVLHGKSQLFLYATNKKLWQTIVTEFENLNWEILAVSPAIFYENISESRLLDPKEVNRILSNFDSSPDLSFVGSNHGVSRDLKLTTPKQSKNIWLTTGLLILFLVSLLGAFLTMPGSKRSLSFAKPAPVASEIPQLIEVPSPSPLPLAKTELKVQILNGSGVVGQAAKVKGQLTSLGFVLIETGNSPQTASQTVVSFSKKVSQEVQDELLIELKKIFPDLESEESSFGEYDISIVTG